jgi:hypothetical protein
LQRWRSENRGPSYLKLSKRVTYPVEDILAFERDQKRVRQNSHEFSLRQHGASSTPDIVPPPVNADSSPSIITRLISCEEAISVTKLPAYYFTDAEVRKQLEIPHYLVGKLVRFKLDELRQWEISRACQAFGITSELNPSIGQSDESSRNIEVKIGLREALRRLNSKTLGH